MDKHKIAEALGLKIYDQNRKDFYYLGKVAQCSIVRLADYLASPAGEKAVRDKVRELWLSASTGNVWYAEGTDDTVMVALYNVNTPTQIEQFCASTEAEAYAAAVIWLTERSEK